MEIDVDAGVNDSVDAEDVDNNADVDVDKSWGDGNAAAISFPVDGKC